MRGAKSIAVVVAVMVTVSFNHQARGAIPWAANWQQATARAQRYRQLVLIHFTRDNCPPCVKLERSVFSRPEVRRAIASNYVPLKASTSENAALSRRYGIEQVPTDVIVTPEGKEIWRDTSPQDPNQYIAMLDRVAAHEHIGTPLKNPSDSPTSPASSSPQGPNRASAFPVEAASSNSTNSTASTDSTDFRAASRNRFIPASSPNPEAAPRQPGSATAASSGSAPSATSFPSPTTDRPVSNPFADRSTRRTASPPRAEADSNTTSPYRENGLSPSAPAPDQTNSPQETVNQFAKDRSTDPSRHPAASQETGPDTLRPRAGTGKASRHGADDPTNLALEGYCCVTLAEEEKWVKGDPRWGVNHRGRTYLFTSPQQQQRFLNNHDEYAPALSGYDCVKYAERGVLVEGKRAHGVFYRDHIFLFADEASLEKFWQTPSRYVPVVEQERNHQAARPTR
ncbi:MAG: thioredoxin family protein [Planctomycetota bacterium]